MKFETDMSKNFFKLYSEARGVANHRNEIIKHKEINSLSYFNEVFMTFMIFLLSGLLAKTNENTIIVICGYFLIILAFCYLLLNISRTVASFMFRKKQGFKNVLIIDKDGITDVSSFPGTKILFTWEKIIGIVVKKNTIVVLTDSKVYFYFDKSNNKLIDCIKKYKKDILIIK